MSTALMNNYARSEVAFDHGEGAYLFSTDGRRFLDFCSGIAVTGLGHSHPKLVDAVTNQAKKLWHVANLHQIPEQEELGRKLVDNSFADRAFFCNSGAEAMEASIKIARKYHDETGNPDRYRVIVMEGAFHGRTLATIAATGTEKVLKGFDPIVDAFDRVAFGNLNELRVAIGEETAAILLEPIQGEGGIRPAAQDYLKAAREIADEFGVLLMFDEIQCGMGRTGKLFAHEWAGIAPDVMALAKGLGGGFPIGAVLATENAAQAITPGSHGTTFGGNPMAMAAGNAVMDVLLEPGFLDGVQTSGSTLMDQLVGLVSRRPKVFAEARGAGLMLGLKCVVPAVEMVGELRAAGLIVVGGGENTIRLLPPLIIGQSEIDEAVAKLDQVAADWEGA